MSSISPIKENIERFYAEYSEKSDEELYALINTLDFKYYATGIAAAKILEERKKKADDIKHQELLEALSKIMPVSDFIQNTAVNGSQNGVKQKESINLLNRPVGYIWLTAIGGVLCAIIIYLVRSHLGISL
ncbi:MAG: hypothetical protein K9L79_07355 [Methylobacter tundripaludum]|nr:hypothetical protein [Methylobacter tundripaludum]